MLKKEFLDVLNQKLSLISDKEREDIILEFGTYIDDNTVYNQIEQLITDTDEPLYLHATTMKNHQPYNQGTGATEFDTY